MGLPSAQAPPIRVHAAPILLYTLCLELELTLAQSGPGFASGTRAPPLSPTRRTHRPATRDGPRGSVKQGGHTVKSLPRFQRTAAEPRRRVQRAAGVRGRRLLAAEEGTQGGRGRGDAAPPGGWRTKPQPTGPGPMADASASLTARRFGALQRPLPTELLGRNASYSLTMLPADPDGQAPRAPLEPR